MITVCLLSHRYVCGPLVSLSFDTTVVLESDDVVFSGVDCSYSRLPWFLLWGILNKEQNITTFT